MPDSEPNQANSARRVASYLSEKTWISLGFVLTLLTAAVALTHTAGGIDKKFLEQGHQIDQILQRLATQSERIATMPTREDFRSREAAWQSWVRELRASVSSDLRASIPEAPK